MNTKLKGEYLTSGSRSAKSPTKKLVLQMLTSVEKLGGQEEWRPLNDYDGCYEVSSLGRVRSINRTIVTSAGKTRRCNGRVLQQQMAWTGYLLVNVSSLGSMKKISVHRAVALAFCIKRIGADQVNHKNSKRHDNTALNLEWVTAVENAAHAVSVGRRCPIRNSGYGNCKLTLVDVLRIRALSKSGARICDLTRLFGVSRNTVIRVISNKTWVAQ